MGYNFPLADEEFNLKTVMDTINTSIQSSTITSYFRPGYWKEIAQVLNELSSHEDYAGTKFPMICLSEFYKLNKTDAQTTNSVDFTLFLLTDSETNYSSQQRDNISFDGILLPVYNALITGILDNKWFRNENREIIHSFEKLPYMGSEGVNQNKLNEVVDAIQLDFTDTKILNLKKY